MSSPTSTSRLRTLTRGLSTSSQTMRTPRPMRPMRAVTSTEGPLHVKGTFEHHDPKVVKAVTARLAKSPADHAGTHSIIRHFPAKDPSNYPSYQDLHTRPMKATPAIHAQGQYRRFLGQMYVHRSRANIAKTMAKYGKTKPGWSTSWVKNARAGS
jgi:hypothetical protein